MNEALLETFITLYRTRNVRKTAEILYLTQPSVTSRLQALESIVGFSLFNRSQRKITPTDAGEILYPYAVSLIEKWQEGVFQIQKHENSYQGKIKIGIYYSGITFYSPFIIEFTKRYPDVNVVVSTGHSKDIVNLVNSHEIDIGISMIEGNKSLEHEVLFDEPIIAVVHHTHHLANSSHIEKVDVEKEKFVLINSNLFDRRLLGQLGFPLNVIAEPDNLDFTKKIIEKEQAISLLP